MELLRWGAPLLLVTQFCPKKVLLQTPNFNAKVKYTPRAGANSELASCNKKGRVDVKVEDSGPGMEPAEYALCIWSVSYAHLVAIGTPSNVPGCGLGFKAIAEHIALNCIMLKLNSPPQKY